MLWLISLGPICRRIAWRQACYLPLDLESGQCLDSEKSWSWHWSPLTGVLRWLREGVQTVPGCMLPPQGWGGVEEWCLRAVALSQVKQGVCFEVVDLWCWWSRMELGHIRTTDCQGWWCRRMWPHFLWFRVGSDCPQLAGYRQGETHHVVVDWSGYLGGVPLMDKFFPRGSWRPGRCWIRGSNDYIRSGPWLSYHGRG